MSDLPSGPAHVAEDAVRVGTRLRCDDGFDCMDAGSVVTVEADEAGDLFVPCRCGRHYLDGQLGSPDDDHVFVGFWLEEAA